MAQTLTITDGTTSVNLVNTSGFFLRGWEPGVGSSRILSSYSSLYDGNKLQSVKRDNVRETLTVSLTASSQDNAAAQLQTLNELLRQAHLYHTSSRYTTPVYITAKADSETNTRYSLLFNGQVNPPTSPHSVLFKSEYVWNNLSLYIEREPYWRSHAPGDLPAAPISLVNPENASANGTRQPVANHQHTIALSKIFNYDASLTAFSSDLSASSTFNYFEVSASTPTTGDMIYFGSSRGFHNIVLNLSAGYSDIAVLPDVEYYNGAAWVDVPDVAYYPANYDDNNSVFGAPSNIGAIRVIHVSNLVSWASTTINSQDLYWIRIVLTNPPTGTATQATFPVYSLSSNYLEIPATSIDGDVPPKIVIAGRNPAGDYTETTPKPYYPSRIYIGAKSRGLGASEFESMVSLSYDGSSFGAISESADTTLTLDGDSPGGVNYTTDFTTSATLGMRVNTVSLLEPYIGKYRFFVRAQQVGGATGDCSVAAQFTMTQYIKYPPPTNVYKKAVYFQTKEVDLQSADDGIELIDLGIVQFPFSDLALEDNISNAGAYLDMDIMAARSTGASSLALYDMIFLPIDEWHCTLEDPVHNTADADSCLTMQSAIQLDSGVLGNKRLIKTLIHYADDAITGQTPGVNWELRGIYPELLSDTKYRLYFIIAHYNGVFGTLPMMSPLGSGLVCEIHAHEQWELLRGAD